MAGRDHLPRRSMSAVGGGPDPAHSRLWAGFGSGPARPCPSAGEAPRSEPRDRYWEVRRRGRQLRRPKERSPVMLAHGQGFNPEKPNRCPGPSGERHLPDAHYWAVKTAYAILLFSNPATLRSESGHQGLNPASTPHHRRNETRTEVPMKNPGLRGKRPGLLDHRVARGWGLGVPLGLE
jgi:hypothetical protein